MADRMPAAPKLFLPMVLVNFPSGLPTESVPLWLGWLWKASPVWHTLYGKKYLIQYGKGVCSRGVWWSVRSKLRLLCLPGGVPQKAKKEHSNPRRPSDPFPPLIRP